MYAGCEIQWAELAESNQDLPASSAMMFSNRSLSQWLVILAFAGVTTQIVLRDQSGKTSFSSQIKVLKKRNKHHHDYDVSRPMVTVTLTSLEN